MEKIMKLFPVMPGYKEGGKLVLAIAFYVIAPLFAFMIVAVILGLTIILSPLVAVAALVLALYSLMGIIFAVMGFIGTDLSGSNSQKIE